MHASASMFRPLATSRRWALATALGSAALLGGCVVAPVPGPVYAEPAGYPVNAGVYAPIAPPQPYYEVQPAMPFPGAVWISGSCSLIKDGFSRREWKVDCSTASGVLMLWARSSSECG